MGTASAGAKPQGFWHVKGTAYRSCMLLFICLLTFGSYYCYDIPGALKGAFFRHFDGLTQLQYSLLYSLYSWPNTVQVFFGGYVMDRYLGMFMRLFTAHRSALNLLPAQGSASAAPSAASSSSRASSW